MSWYVFHSFVHSPPTSSTNTDLCQVYLIASTIAFGIQFLALTDSEFPVWYPYYGTWFFGIAVELVLIVVPNIYNRPKDVFGFAILVIQALRLFGFISLPALYFGLRNDHKEYASSDVERQSLLRKKLGQKAGNSSETTLNGNGYGTTADTTSQDSDTAEENSSDTDSEDSWLAEQRKAQKKIDKRLEQDGNWYTYAKGFMVGRLQCRAELSNVNIPRSSSRTFGPTTIGICSSELFLWDAAYSQRTPSTYLFPTKWVS